MISIIKEGKLFDYSKNTISMVIDLLIECIEKNKNNSIKILECGSGTSNVTHEIVKYLRPFDSITCVEINEQNVLKARNKLKKDERITIHRTYFWHCNLSRIFLNAMFNRSQHYLSRGL